MRWCSRSCLFNFPEINKYINQWLQLPWRLAQTCTAVSMCSAGRRLLAKLEFNRKLRVTLMCEKAVSPSLIYCMKKSVLEIQRDDFKCAEAGEVTLKWSHSSFSYNNCRFKGYYLWVDENTLLKTHKVWLCSSIICIIDQRCLCTVECKVCKGCMFTVRLNSLSEQKCIPCASKVVMMKPNRRQHLCLFIKRKHWKLWNLNLSTFNELLKMQQQVFSRISEILIHLWNVFEHIPLICFS